MAQKIMIQKTKECFFCGTKEDLHLHHCIYGRGRREISDLFGLTVYLCRRHHTDGEYAVHRNTRMDMAVKKQAQKCFEDEYGHEKYMALFERDYIKGEIG